MASSLRLVVLAALSLLTTLPAAAPAQTPLFAPRRDFPVGGSPEAVAVGDFDRDGTVDVVTSQHVTNVVSVLLGNGDGSFHQGSTAAVPTPGALAVGDFNRDGVPDLAVANQASNTLAVLLGKGDGTFRSAPNVDVLPPVSMAAGDFNRDGALDLAIVNGAPAVFVLLGNGDGTFQPARSFAADGANRGVTVGDFNGDGVLDVATVNDVGTTSSNSTISLLLGQGDGSFQAARILPAGFVGAFPGVVDVGDFNRDGALDLLVLNNDGNGSSVVSLHLGNGDGTFPPPRRLLASSRDFRAMTVADFDGDGKLDLVATNVLRGATSDEHAVWALLGNGDGTFQTPRSFEATQVPNSVAVGDVNADGSLDLVVANVGAATVSLFLNNAEPFWANMVHVTAMGHSLQKTSGCGGCFDAGAIARQRIPAGGGYAEFMATETALVRVGGLSRLAAGLDCERIDFGVRLQAGFAEAREHGVYRADTTFVTGDVFRITVQAGVVTYAKNGVVFFTSPTPADSPLSFVAVLADLDSTLSNVVIVADP